MNRLMDIARSFQFAPSTPRSACPAEERAYDINDKNDKRVVAVPHREVTTQISSPQNLPAMPPGVRLIEWNLKEPPVCLEVYSLVTDTTKFAQSTLGQIQRLLEDPKAKVGWSMPQLIDRLAQVGVIVELESEESGVNLSERPRRPRRYY